jgi:hypothetical protein
MGYVTIQQGHIVDCLDGKKIFHDIIEALGTHRVAHGTIKDGVVIAMSYIAYDAMHSYLSSLTCSMGDYPDTEVKKLYGYKVRETELDEGVAWELWFREC